MKKTIILALIILFVFAGVVESQSLYTKNRTYLGLSTDTKSTTGIPVGSTFYETDNKSMFIYNGSSWIIQTGVSIVDDETLSPTVATVNAGTAATGALSCYGFDSMTFSFKITSFVSNINALIEFTDDGTNWFIADDMTTSTQYTANGTFSLRTEDSANHAQVRLRVSTMASGTPAMAMEQRLYKQE